MKRERQTPISFRFPCWSQRQSSYKIFIHKNVFLCKIAGSFNSGGELTTFPDNWNSVSFIQWKFRIREHHTLVDNMYISLRWQRQTKKKRYRRPFLDSTWVDYKWKSLISLRLLGLECSLALSLGMRGHVYPQWVYLDSKFHCCLIFPLAGTGRDRGRKPSSI